MLPLRILAWSTVVVSLSLFPQRVLASDLAILNEKTWDQFVPKGKEVDAIYGDFVLRNDKIVVVIANPIAGRNANMTVRDVGGSIIDLTTRGRQSDQLSAYYPGARRYPYRLTAIGAEGEIGLDIPGSTNRDAISFEAVEGKLATRASVLTGKVVQIQLVAPAAADRPEVRLAYTLREGASAVEVRTQFFNKSDKPIKVTLVDDFRADRTFTTAKPGETDLAWFYDKWWGQAYGVVARGAKLRLTGSPAEPRVIEFLIDGKPTVDLETGVKIEVVRHIFPASDLVTVKAIHARLTAENPSLASQVVVVRDTKGKAIPQAEVELRRDGELYGLAATESDGSVQLDLPPGNYQAKVTALARGSKEFTIDAGGAAKLKPINIELPAAPRVVAEITDTGGKPIPSKVQFVGLNGTLNPFFFEQTGEHAVHNLYYSPNGRFTQEIAPGKYDVLVSYGPEYNVEKLQIDAKAGEDVPLKATLKRVVQSPGWISTDFHSHSSPSGDNTSSQLGRVLNLLCEHIEFAPCTEHNRLDTYVPHLKVLGVAHLLATCTGMELTESRGTINHQNAFPLVLKPRTQDNGAPLIDPNPEEQIKRLALWDNGSEKLIQQNHPDMGEMFYDRDGNRIPDDGFKGMFEYQDVIEVHPIHDVLDMSPLRYGETVDKKTNRKIKNQYNNSIFNWLQLINQGRRLPGVVNTDAHYNFHGSGGIRNYVKCQTDDPAKIDPMDIVHAAEKGHIIMTNGPYLDVTLLEGASASGAQPATPRQAIPGDDIALPGGFGTLHVRVQCPNWFNIDRVQVLLNGSMDPKLNWTRSANPDAFTDSVVKFDRRIPIEFKTDKHVIVIAGGENSSIGPVMGPDYGKQKPTAISNPIFVDADGGGYKANGDTLGYPLPVKEQRAVPKEKGTAGRL